MEKVKVFYHKKADTIDVWFGNPDDEVSADEAGDGVILKKNKNSDVIGIEKLYVSKTMGKQPVVPMEILVM